MHTPIPALLTLLSLSLYPATHAKDDPTEISCFEAYTMHCCPSLTSGNAPCDSSSTPSIANVTGCLASDNPSAWVCCINNVRTFPVPETTKLRANGKQDQTIHDWGCLPAFTALPHWPFDADDKTAKAESWPPLPDSEEPPTEELLTEESSIEEPPKVSKHSSMRFRNLAMMNRKMGKGTSMIRREHSKGIMEELDEDMDGEVEAKCRYLATGFMGEFACRQNDLE
jgi:hypothetical protein